MRESILTIPISEIFEPKCECPICRLRNMLEDRCIDYIMGAAMMEPDVRVETNKLGFCHTHLQQMRGKKNRLSLALMLHTHLQAVNEQIFERKSLFEGKAAKQRKISFVNNECFVCSKIDWGMERLLTTFFEMFENDRNFRDLFNNQEYICLPHYDMLVSQSLSMLNKKYHSEFEKSCSKLVKTYLDTLCADVGHYCDMYDYRNTGKDADWGNSKDSIERSIKFLTTR